MKITFIGMDAIYSLRHLEALEEKFDVVCIICAAPRDYQGNDDLSLKNMLYRNARKRKIPFYFAKNISSEKMETVIRKTGCDLICVASCSQLLKKNIIDIPKFGVINAHGAKLPYYKGPNPDYWIFYFQEDEGAVTIHFIDEGEDSGDIIHQEVFKIPFGMTRKEYRAQILSRSPKLMQQSVLELESGIARRRKQEEIKNFRARNLRPEDKIIDFKEWDARHVYHFLRGTDMLDKQYQQSVWKAFIVDYSEDISDFLNKKNVIICKSGGGTIQKSIQPQAIGKDYYTKELKRFFLFNVEQGW